ncbi:hypothetical protein [Marinicella rhabdoformis]|uniref:hypothetical protein n=1 Tax=Marinicella rhabdoformis TaxID=2580566 RepID=UPI0012AEDDCA|nr:hypothetical protein [Marinicella rhabdoformis]
MKYLRKYLLLLLLIPTFGLAEGEKKSGLTPENIHDLGVMLSPAESQKQKMALKLSAQWHAGLNKFLAETEDPYLLALALFRIVNDDSHRQGMSVIKGQEKKPSNLPAEQIAKNINNLVENAAQLRPETITILAGICFYQSIVPHCDKPLMINSRIKHDRLNLISYIQPLALSIQENDQEKITKLLNLMTKTAYSDMHFYLLPSFQEAIKRYATANPMPQEVVDNELAFYKKMQSPSDEAKASRKKHMRTELLYLVEVSTLMSFPVPGFRVLMDYCKKDSSLHNQCLKVADILIEKSRDDISTIVGYQIKKSVLEVTNKKDAATTVQSQLETYKEKRQCLLDYINEHRFNDVLKGIEQDRIRNNPMHTEFENFIKQTEYLYEKRIDQADIKDPAYCLTE